MKEDNMEKQIDPKQKREIDSYSTALQSLLYDKKAGPQIHQMLKEVPPEESIPQATLLINSKMEDTIRARGRKPDLGVVLVSNVNLIGELVNLGNEGGFFNLTEEQVPPILQTTMQKYIEKGLQDKTIDPIELQKAVEPLMSEEQRQQGMQVAQQAGLPSQPGAEQAMETYANQRVSEAKGQMEKEFQKKMQQNQGGA